jgi:hypothetical protein
MNAAFSNSPGPYRDRFDTKKESVLSAETAGIIKPSVSGDRE